MQCHACGLGPPITLSITINVERGQTSLPEKVLVIKTTRRIFLSYLPPHHLDYKFGEIQTKYTC